MRRTGTMAAVAVLVLATVVGVGTAGGAGITTHRWMAEEAVDLVDDPALAAVLRDNLVMVQTGVAFPDVGYVGDNTYGETAHWQRYVDNLVDAIVARSDCGDIGDPDGPCAELIAFTMGIAAHGMGDEVFDWLFEPNSPDRDEYFTGVPTANEDGAETQMDIVAIGRYGVARPLPGHVPDESLVLDAFIDSGRPGVTADQFELVPMLPVLWDVEKGWADDHLADVEAAMPWMAANLVIAPGGVDFAATAIAGYWSTLWGRLTGDQPATTVSITYPAPEQTGIPATGWDRPSFQPGSSRGRGGAANRITAVLTSARPYLTGDPVGDADVSNAMAPGTMTITNLTDGTAVPLLAGYPRSVPYGADAGEHLIDVQPAENLDTCTWYRIDVGVDTPLLDAERRPVEPYSWRFRTECDDEPEPTSSTTVPATTAPVTETSPITTMASPAPQGEPAPGGVDPATGPAATGPDPGPYATPAARASVAVPVPRTPGFTG